MNKWEESFREMMSNENNQLEYKYPLQFGNYIYEGQWDKENKNRQGFGIELYYTT